MVGININIDRENWIYYILTGQKTIETRPASCAGAWKKHIGETIGLVRTTANGTTGLLVGTALLVAVKNYKDKEEFDNDLKKHLFKIGYGGWNNNKRCGLVLDNVQRVNPPRKLKPGGMGTVREIEFA